jgi:hypothetical protein
MVELYINRCAFKLIFFLSQMAFICIPGLSQDNKFFLTNTPSDSSSLVTVKLPVDIPSKNHLINFHAGFELGYGRVFRKYHIEINPWYRVSINTDLINGDCVYLGFVGQVDYKSNIALTMGMNFEYLFFHKSVYDRSRFLMTKMNENYFYYCFPFILSTSIRYRNFVFSPELGFLKGFLISSEYIVKLSDSLNNASVMKIKDIIYNKDYSSIVCGIKIGKKDSRLIFDLKYLIGITKVMLFEHDPNSIYGPPPNSYWRKNVLSLSIQYFLKY